VSLTSEIRRPDGFVRAFIDLQFPHLKALARECNERARTLGLSRLPNPHERRGASMLVGTAVDYRVRAYFDRHINDSDAVLRGLTFLCNLKEFRKPFVDPATGSHREAIGNGLYWADYVITDNPWYWRRRKKIAERLYSSYSRFCSRVRPEGRKLSSTDEERMCRYCALFALLDWVGRSPVDSIVEGLVKLANPKATRMLAKIDAEVVRDLKGLSHLFYSQGRALFKSDKTVAIGSTLAGSRDIGGADCDLIVDGCLLDLKTSLKPTIQTAHLRQLVGYCLLDYDDALRLSSAAIMLTRHSLTHRFSLDELLGSRRNLAELRQDFRAGLQQQFASRVRVATSRGMSRPRATPLRA